MTRILALALALVALPAFAQTTTTVTQQPQQQATPPPPPPPSNTSSGSGTSTTVTTQTAPQPTPPSSSTQVVVNPNDPNYVPPPPPSTRVRVDEDTGVTAVPTGRSAVAIIATDALWGGVAGALVGGGITLIDQGNNWARNLMVGAGVGVLAGAAYGIYESANQPAPRRAVVDADPGVSNANGPALALAAGHF